MMTLETKKYLMDLSEKNLSTLMRLSSKLSKEKSRIDKLIARIQRNQKELENC